jgi:hypothetical protein
MAKTVQELQALLQNEEETPIEILPNGEIRPVGRTGSAELAGKKPITMKEDLGGEYNHGY